MALYAPQQQFQAPAVIAQNNFHHAHNNTNFSSASNQFAQNSRGQVTSSEPTTTKSTEPSDECFTIDFSNLSGDSISFSKWNGMNAVPLKPDIQPAIFGLGSGNTEQGLVDNFDNIKIPLKDFTNIYDGSEAQSKCSEKFKFLPIQMILLSLVTNDIKSRESDIKAMATFIQYTHNKYMSTSENHKKNPVKGSKGGKVKSVGRSVTFVIPVDIPLSGRQLLVDAAKLAGFTVRNIFTPDVALIAHMYSELSPGQLLFESSNDVHVLSIVNNAVSKSFTLSLFTCEINPSTYSMERICPIASVSGGIGSKLVSDLCKKANIATSAIAGVLLTENMDSQSVKEVKKALSHVVSSNVVTQSYGAVVRGACLLSAAELDSSKDYIQNNSGAWSIVYQLPVADGFLTSEVGLVLEKSQCEVSSALTSVETIFVGDARVSKLDHGILRPSKGASMSVSREYRRSSSDKEIDFPRLLLCHRVSSLSPWVAIQYVYPLTSPKGSNATAEKVYASKLRLYIDPHTGLPVAEMKQGESAGQIRQSRSFWLQVLICVLALLFIPGAFFGYNAWSEYSTMRSHEAWLRDFYVQHAPEKLKKDPQLVVKTIKKYNGRMFLLWRSLEKSYGLKIKPPPQVVDAEL